MKIQIVFTEKDIERVLAEHCRNQFKIDPCNVELRQTEADVFVVKVEGEYLPEQ